MEISTSHLELSLMDKISHEVSSNFSSKCNSRALYKLNSLVYFMHHSEDSSRNILGNGSMTEYIYTSFEVMTLKDVIRKPTSVVS